MYFNEEQVKNIIIVPFFEKLGFKKDEIEFETNLRIMIPRKGHMKIGQIISKNVFSDIVYKYNINGISKNIFLVEVKRMDHNITDKDVEQAVCYARLLDDMPPFCIISNGKDNRLIDTVSKEEIKDISQSRYIKSNFCITLDEELKNEALKAFIGLNLVNLIEFCKLQSISNFKDIMSIETSTKTVIDEIHCDREKYLMDFEEFLNSDSRVYAIIGKSGYGKTNLVYSIWKKYQNTHPILFYNAGLLNRSLSFSIQEDFHFLLSRNYDFYELIKRINDITINCSKKVFIILDGLDENNNIDELKLELNDLVKKINNSNIYFILTCKINDDKFDLWYDFIHFKGSETVLGQSVYKSLYGKCKEKVGTYIDKMNDEELELLWTKYKAAYNLAGDLNRENKELSKQPYLLRIIAEVYQNSLIDNDSNEMSLYKTWIEKKINLTNSRDLSRYVLKSIALDIVTVDMAKIKYDAAIEKFINMKDGILALNELINLGMFNISYDKNQSKYLSFPHANLLFYFYCYEIENWQEKRIFELCDEFDKHFSSERNKLLAVLFYIASIQNKYQKKEENWHENIDMELNKICMECGKKINSDSTVTLMLKMKVVNEKEGKVESRFGIAHKNCLPFNFPMFEAIDNNGYFKMTCSDMLAIFKINNFFRDTTDKELMAISNNLKINRTVTKLNRIISSPNYKYLPTLESKGQPFWVIMDFVGNINTGLMHSHKYNNKDYILMFASKYEAEFYILTNLLEKDMEDCYPRAAGVDKKCIRKLKEIYFNKMRGDKKVILHAGYNKGNTMAGILLDFEQIVKISESNLTLREYLRKLKY